MRYGSIFLSGREEAGAEDLLYSTGLKPVQINTSQGVLELDPASDHLHVFNGTKYDGGLSEFRTSDEQQDSLRRRSEGAVQQFTWFEVREVLDIGGRGVSAKIRIPQGSIVFDYRRYTLVETDYNSVLAKLTTAQRNLIQATRSTTRVARVLLLGHFSPVLRIVFRFAVQVGSALVTNVVVAYEPTYKGDW
ncbi:hypothetical protein Aduo_001874 [Ancylostoma duodenale]